MPATIQKMIDKTIEGLSSKFAFLDNILVITKRNIQDYETKIDKIMKKRQQRISNKLTKKRIHLKKSQGIIGTTATTTGEKSGNKEINLIGRGT